MLSEKIRRDIKKNFSQYITIFIIIFMGLFIYTGIKSYMNGMNDSINRYYKENNLQDLNAYGSYNDHDLKRILEYDEVKDVNAILTLPELGTVENKRTHRLSINFITKNTISKFYIKSGERFASKRKGIWLDSYYAKLNNLKVGDSFNFSYDGVEFKEKILGLIYVPDKVYEKKDNSLMFTLHSDYGYVYLSIREIPKKIVKKMTMEKLGIKDEKKFDKKVPEFHRSQYLRYNKVIVDLYDKKDNEIVKEKIEERRHTYAVTNIEDELSYLKYKNEVEEGNGYIGIFSGLFIFIALLSVITSMTRIINKYRKDIGTLKALGFKKSKIMFRYLKSSFKLSFYATTLGIICGHFVFGYLLMNIEMKYYEVPEYKPIFDISAIYCGLFTVALVLFSTYLSTRKILKLNAAETLRVERPNVNIRTLDKTKDGVFAKFSFSSRWNLRDILRNKLRTLLGIIGIVSCVILLTCSFGIRDTLKGYLKLQFNDLYNFKYKLTLSSPIKDEKLEEIEKEYGDATSEEIKIEIEKKNESYPQNLFITDAKKYIRFIDSNGKYIDIKDNGAYITQKLAEKYNYKIGDKIKWHFYRDEKVYETKIIGINKDVQNQNITLSRSYFESLKLKYEPDSLYTKKDLSKIDKIDNVLLIQNKNELKKCVNSMLEFMKNINIILIITAVILCVVIIYNISILSFSEKNYQFATLKILGFDLKQISKIFIKQNIWIMLLSIIIGLPVGNKILNYLFTKSISYDCDLKIIIAFKSYLLVIFIIVITSYLVSLLLCFKIKKIDMVSSLKGNE